VEHEELYHQPGRPKETQTLHTGDERGAVIITARVPWRAPYCQAKIPFLWVSDRILTSTGSVRSERCGSLQALQELLMSSSPWKGSA
jgi:hypothetical protein